MAQESIFGRIGSLARANINAALDKAEDPQKMLDQMLREYANAISEAREAVATTIGQLRLAEADRKEDLDTAAQWQNKALLASQKADQLRSSGQAAEADKFDALAKTALQRQIIEENQAKALEPAIQAQTAQVEQLKKGLSGMEGKYAELESKRDSLVARSKMATAQNKVQDAVSAINITDPSSDLSRFEAKIKREEARALGNAELNASTLDAQFEELELDSDTLEIDARLAALKSGGAAPASAGQISSSAAPIDAEVIDD